MQNLKQSLADGADFYPGLLSQDAQKNLIEQIRLIVKAAPLFTPLMPKTGKPMSVRITNCGSYGWVTDKELGYRYQATHPKTDLPWPDIPKSIMDIWEAVSNYSKPAEACLINFYDDQAKMGLHQDRDELDFEAPVVSISLGDSCLFRIGGSERSDKTSSIKLQSGDVIVLGGKSRLSFHGVDRIYPATSTLLKNGGRINLTLRKVTKS